MKQRPTCAQESIRGEKHIKNTGKQRGEKQRKAREEKRTKTGKQRRRKTQERKEEKNTEKQRGEKHRKARRRKHMKNPGKQRRRKGQTQESKSGKRACRLVCPRLLLPPSATWLLISSRAAVGETTQTVFLQRKLSDKRHSFPQIPLLLACLL